MACTLHSRNKFTILIHVQIRKGCGTRFHLADFHAVHCFGADHHIIDFVFEICTYTRETKGTEICFFFFNFSIFLFYYIFKSAVSYGLLSSILVELVAYCWIGQMILNMVERRI